MSLRKRFFLTLAPLLIVLAGFGGVGVFVLSRLGGRIDAILRENYDSVRAMERLIRAVDRIDSSFRLALVGGKEHEDDARAVYLEGWGDYHEQLYIEEHNITIFPDEPRLVKELDQVTEEYEKRGDHFFLRRRAGDPTRQTDYSGTADRPGLKSVGAEVTRVAEEILRLNERTMDDMSRRAREAAWNSFIGLIVGLTIAVVLVLALTFALVRSVLGPIAAVAEAAQAIGAGQLERRVPVARHDEIGRFAETFNVMTDRLRELRASSLQRLLRARRTSQATIDSFPDPVLVVDLDGRVEFANLAARQMLGVAAPTDGEEPGPAWVPPETLRQPLTSALREQRASLTESFDQVMFLRLGGEDRAFLPQVRPIRDPHGETLGAAVVLSDVTRFRLLDQLKTDLVATASHELKTPLSGLRLAIHLLLEESVGPLTPKQTELLLDARDNAERLLNLIEHLLALARLEQGADAIHVEAKDPVVLLRTAAEAVAARAEGKHITLTVEDAVSLPKVVADPVRLGSALNNLLDNALTYTEPGGRVTLSAAAAGDDMVRLSVADTGIGIPAEYLPHVFEKFFRVPGTAHPPGTGLGLAIVREVVQAHGGHVTCTSEAGKGTVFQLTLPVWKQSSVTPG
jgi:signal transduction histidine kinase